MVLVVSVAYVDGVAELATCTETGFPRVQEDYVTPYTDRLRAGEYDTKPVKTKPEDRDTTSEKLSGVTKGKAKK